MKDRNFYVVHGWMINQLDLSGTELMIYAIIYGFTQDGETQFTGSIKYIEKAIGKSRTTVIDNLKKLTERGFLSKQSEQKNGVTFNSYKTVPGVRKPDGGGTETGRGGGTETVPNNIVKDNIANNIEPEQSSPPLFPEMDTKKKTIFKNSVVNDPEVFKKQFAAPEFEAVDLDFYYHAVRDWSLTKKGVKRDGEGWIATARGFMRRDNENKKLKLSSQNSLSLSEEEKFYLNL